MPRTPAFANCEFENGPTGVSDKAVIPPRLRLDLIDTASLGVRMDDTQDDRTATAVMLLMEAGLQMEDASPQFAMALPYNAAIASRIEQLDRVAGDLQALAAAARVLMNSSDII